MLKNKIIFLLLILCFLTNKLYSSDLQMYSNESIANAIYKAEGESKTKYPYGILTKYKYTSPREACINTIKNQRIRHAKHNCGKDYLTCLRDRYCPINDNKINRFWLNNVKYFLERDNPLNGR